MFAVVLKLVIEKLSGISVSAERSQCKQFLVKYLLEENFVGKQVIT